MSKEKRSVPLYQRSSGSGKPTVKRSGVSATLKTGDVVTADAVTWNVRADSLGDTVPQTGDRLRDTGGRWWVVVTVGAEEAGAYPLACERQPEDDA